MKNEQPAARVSRTLTTEWEKRNLPRIARKLPPWVTPDHLTLVGIVAALGIGAGYVLSHASRWWLLLSIVGLFAHWFGDSLDGTLARVRKTEREKYGYFVDRSADAVSIVVICTSFGLSPFISLSTGLLLAVAYLLIMVHAEICAYVSRTFPMSFAGVGPTEARIALALFTMALVFWTPGDHDVLGRSCTTLDLIGFVTSGALFASFVVLSLIEARRLDRAERIARGLLTSAESAL
jgi:archaetidylinositol phosphate synthase